MKRKNFSNWEKAFIYLNYPIFSYTEIAQHLGRTRGSVEIFIQRQNWKKQNYFTQISKGDKFGDLEVLDIGRIKKRHKHYKCKCVCGYVFEVRGNSLPSGNTTNCGCKNKCPNRIGSIGGKWFNRIKNAAQKRNIEFKVDMTYLDQLLKKQNYKCALTGLDISIVDTLNGIGSTASLDRIDSTMGYIVNNVQFVYKDINIMKLDFKQDYFLNMCEMVYLNRKNNAK